MLCVYNIIITIINNHKLLCFKRDRVPEVGHLHMHIMTNGHFPYPGDDHMYRGEKAFHMVKRTLFLLCSDVRLLQKTK